MGAIESSYYDPSHQQRSISISPSSHVSRARCLPIMYRTTVVFAVIGDHEHDLPFEDVVADKTAAYAGDVFVGLHLLELAAQEPGGC